MVFSTCSENDNVEPSPIPTATDETLTDEQMAFLETVKDTVIRLEDIIAIKAVLFEIWIWFTPVLTDVTYS